MFEEIFFPRTAERYRAAPLVELRERYLVYLRETGARRLTLRKCANDQLSLMRLLKLKEGAGSVPTRSRLRRRSGRGRKDGDAFERHLQARKRFVSQGIGWLRFLVWLDEREKRSHSHHAEVATFEKWLRDERGLSGATVQSYCAAADRFFSWLVGNDVALSAVRMRHIDDAVAAEHTRGASTRRPARSRAASEGVLLVRRSPRLVLVGAGRGHHAAPLHGGRDRPQGREARGCRAPARVRRGRSYCRQARPGNPDAVHRLRAEGRRSRRPPAGRPGLGKRDAPCPLLKAGPNASLAAVAGVGHTILRYIREARPSGFGRGLFFTSRAPIRPLTRKTLDKMVRDRLAAIGVVDGRRGPHALRHAAAQHLLDQGMSMKVIGDFLGHRDPSSTAIYAKVNLTALREVAALDLEGLA